MVIGQKLGSYEVLAKLGEGGMGEVYRARDRKLNRDVAIKVLSDLFAADPERIARFEREAQTLASLSHPNIAHVYGVIEQPAALVMQLVEGEDLSHRIGRGRMPLDETVPIARQLADALETAHERGIVHRDLKPANIKLAPGGLVKVLDFGLAKAIDSPTGSAVDVTHSPTLTVRSTQAGVILGTASYMAPEQARGRDVDERADIWAFGCVLFEMLTGRVAFPGENVTEILAKIIERDPDWQALPSGTPPAIRRLLRRCLEKDPRRRLAAIADARLELEEATSTVLDDARSPSAPDSPRVRSLLFATVGLLTLIAAVTTVGWLRAARVLPPTMPKRADVAATLGVNVPDLAALTDRFAVSRDGSMLAIVDGNRGGLLLRRSSSLDAAPIAGAPPDAYSPVFSPDGKWIAFRTDQALMKIPAEGGQPAQIAQGSDDYYINLTWGTDDRIRYPSLHNDAIRSVSAGGGPVDSISFGPHAWISRAVGLSSGRLLVSGMIDGESQISVRNPDGTLRKLTAGWDAQIAPTGHLLFSRAEGTTWSILAAPFDASTATLVGEPFVLARDVPVRYATPAAVSAAGDLFYVAGTPRSDRRIVSVDRSGAERDVAAPPGAWVSEAISPDGRRLALGRFEGARRTIWTLTLDTSALTQVTYADDTFAPQWLADGKHVVFSLFPINPALRQTSLWTTLTDGQGKVEPVAAQWDAYPGLGPSDARRLYYSAYQAPNQGQEDIVSLAIGGPASKPTNVLATPSYEHLPTPSPDGRWLAYETNASGRFEARVAPLADMAASVQVSTRGGGPIRWSVDSSKFYYTDGDSLAAIDVKPGGPVLTSRRVLVELPGDWRGRADVMPNGERAILIRGGLIYSDIVVVHGVLARENER
jgi:serine/threonine protein kinase/Tol biopolymer transport system component